MDLAVRVYAIAGEGLIAKRFALRDQMERASLSVPSNVAEGFERGTRAEFHRFLSIAKASCAELRTQLYLSHRLHYIDDATLKETLNDAEEVGRIIGKLRMTVARHRAAERSEPRAESMAKR
ncbi:MAG: ribosomal protein [Acidobacteria bacterium]|nr:ribosomal protein [Acidobacteriota bacterium]